MIEILDQMAHAGFFAAMLRIGAPLLIATIGEIFAERAGVLNLGIEGSMLLGAMVGFTVAYYSGSLWLGVAAAALAGMVMAALMAGLAVGLGLSQHVCGLGVTLLASGLAFYGYRLIFGQPSQPPSVEAFAPLDLPVLSELPFFGEALFSHVSLVYLALAMVPMAAWVLYRTPFGLDLRTVGENPQAAAAAGIAVLRMRTIAVLISGACFGVAGAYFSLAQFNAFTFGVISGRGWVCIALVVLARWDPWRAGLAALLFAATDALGLRLQSSGGIDLPYQLFLALPFLVTIIAMALLSRRALAPAALLKPYRAEER